MTDTNEKLQETKRLMGALLRMPPKPHSEMKLGKPTAKPKPSLARKPRSKRAS